VTDHLLEDGERDAFAEFVREDQPRRRKPGEPRAVGREDLLDALRLTEEDVGAGAGAPAPKPLAEMSVEELRRHLEQNAGAAGPALLEAMRR
jgi:hypothetical protein